MTEERRLLILGSSEEFTDLVQLAVREGIYTVVADGYKGNPAKKYATVSYDVSIFDIEAMKEFCRKERINGIVTAYSDTLFEQAVQIAAAAELPYYVTPGQLPWYREKDRQKELMARVGIDTTKYRRLRRDFTAADLEGMQFPLVIKPVNGYGSKGIFVVYDEKELREHFDAVAGSMHRDDILAEEYCSWPEFNSMAWLADGQVYILSVNDRERIPNGRDRVPLLSRIVYPSRHLNEFYDEVRAVYTAFAAAAGQTDGPISLQFFWKPGQRLKVCEFAGRPLAYEHEIFEYVAGFSLPQLLLNGVYDRDAMREQLEAHDPFYRKTAAAIYYVGEEKTITDLRTLREIAQWDGVWDTALYYNEGDSFSFSNYYAYVVRYFIGAGDRAALDVLTQRIYDTAEALGPQGENILAPFAIPRDGEEFTV